MGKRELVALLNLSPWCLVMVEWLLLAVPWGCLQCVIVVFSDHNHLLFLGYVWPQGHNLNNLDRGSLGDGTHQTSTLLAMWFQTRRFFS